MKVEFMRRESEVSASPIARMEGHFEKYPAIGETIWFDRPYIVKDVIWRSLNSVVYILVPKEPERREVERKE